MSKTRNDALDDADDLGRLEATIRAAGSFVVPSDDLRPRVIDAARERLGVGRIKRRMLVCSLTVLILWSLCIPLRDDLDLLRSHWTAPSSTEMHRRALEIAANSGLGPSWGLAEAFTQVRQSKAQVFGRIMPGL